MKFPVFILIIYSEELRQYGHHVCSDKDPLSHGTIGFREKETGAKSVVVGTAQRASARVFCVTVSLDRQKDML